MRACTCTFTDVGMRVDTDGAMTMTFDLNTKALLWSDDR